MIQRASERALRQGTTLEKVLETAREIRRETDAGLIVFSYLNPILKFGLARFAETAAACGVDGALVTDLPVEEAEAEAEVEAAAEGRAETGSYLRLMRGHGLATVFLAAPTSPPERLKRIAEASPALSMPYREPA